MTGCNYNERILPPSNVILIYNEVCDYRCLMCSRRKQQRHEMRQWKLEDITGPRLQSLWGHVKHMNVGAVGEPSTVPYFHDLLAYFTSRGVPCSFTSNGSRLRASEVRKNLLADVIISLHTVDEPTYDRMTGTRGWLPKVLQNVRDLAERPRDYRLVLVAVITDMNVRQLPGLAEFTREIDADELRMLPLADANQVGLFEGYPQEILYHNTEDDRQAVARAYEIMGGVRRGGEEIGNIKCQGILTPEERSAKIVSLIPSCTAIDTQMVIITDGRVVPCCFISPGERGVVVRANDSGAWCRDGIDFGNVLEQPWEDIWYGEKYEAFRQSVRAGTQPLCHKYCKNWG